MKRIVYLLFLAILNACDICSHTPIEKKEITGTYICKTEKFTDTLIVYSNNTYYHSCSAAFTHERIVQTNKKWAYSSFDNQFYFHNYIMHTGDSLEATLSCRPYKCQNNIIYIDMTISGEIKYVKQ